MRLLLDEHHSLKVATQLLNAGFDVVAASAQERTRNVTDYELLAAATADDRVIVTENIADLIVLATRSDADGHKYPGNILTLPEKFNRSRSSYPGWLIRALKAFLNAPAPVGDSWVWWL